MLVLSRKKNQDIIIADNIVVKIIEIVDNTIVRLGIDAPKDVVVDRREVHEKRKAGLSPVAAIVT